MNEILSKLAQCVEFGKINKVSPYPPNMKDHDGSDELAKRALEEGIRPDEILENALIPAMAIVGSKFSRCEICTSNVNVGKSYAWSYDPHQALFSNRGDKKERNIYYWNSIRRPA